MLVQIRQLTEEQEAIISASIKELPGFKDLLRAAPFESLKKAASEGPVIVLNHAKFRCDALIITSGQEAPRVCLPLDNDFYSDSIELFKELVQGRKGFGLRSKKYDETLRQVMKILWNQFVSKFVQKLKELDVNEGSRIWWSPTSVLSAFLFHAAGPYQGTDDSMKYILDDYIPSYTLTPASLILARSSVQNGTEKMPFAADTRLLSAKKKETGSSEVVGASINNSSMIAQLQKQ
ncbi:hypothetical protein ACEPAF_9119 [Sanghuangporus sanghuang]